MQNRVKRIERQLQVKDLLSFKQFKLDIMGIIGRADFEQKTRHELFDLLFKFDYQDAYKEYVKGNFDFGSFKDSLYEVIQ